MLAFLNQVRKPTTGPSARSAAQKCGSNRSCNPTLVVFIGYLTMYLIRKNFNIAQNDMISTYGLSMTQLGDDRLWASPSLMAWVKRWFLTTPTAKDTKQFLPFMLILSAICMLGFSASMGSGSVSLFLMIAFYALSGFFPEYRRFVQLLHHHQMDAAS